MPELIVNLDVPDDQATFCADKDLIITPVTLAEADQLALALAGIADTQEVTVGALKTLIDVLETKGAQSADIEKSIHMLLEPNRLAAEKVHFVRLLLGRSARVGQMGSDRGTMQ